MNKVIAFFLIFLVQSCQFFDKKVPDENVLLQQELKKINWEQVDEFPSFTVCDSLSDTYSKQTCFYETLSSQLHSKLKDDSIAKLFPQIDTIQVKVIISSNADVNFEAIISDSIVLHPKEKELVKGLYDFSIALEESATSFNPAILANYVYELTKLFNQFYNECPVLKEENETIKEFRIKLIETTATIMKNGMKCLGIEVPERM
jgi:glycyl-tRNA synthetase beta subunit